MGSNEGNDIGQEQVPGTKEPRLTGDKIQTKQGGILTRLAFLASVSEL